MSAFEKSVNCKDIAPLLVFYTCDEVSDRERKEIEAHVASPLVIESEPPRHRLARPQHPQLAERTGPVPVRGAHTARFVA